MQWTPAPRMRGRAGALSILKFKKQTLCFFQFTGKTNRSFYDETCDNIFGSSCFNIVVVCFIHGCFSRRKQ
jgi:hypothetical protein